MASSYSDLGIELMATGENSGTWGDKTNTNLQIVEKAIAGYVEKSIAGGAATTALSITDGDTTESTSVARHAVIKLTGTITGNQIVTVPDSIEKVYIVVNGTSGAYTVQFKTASGTGITFGTSDKGTRLVFSDGTNIVDTATGGVGSYDLNGDSLILDEDQDTTITADTDDQIDIAIAGADDFRFTANTFTALSGSSVVIPDGGLTLGSTAVTSTAAELNILDGVTSTTAELNILDGVTSTAAELNILDGVTSTTAELNILDGVTSTAAELNIVDGNTSATSTTVADADRVVLNDNGTMVQVAVTDLAAYFDDEITAMPNLTSVGTLTTLTVDNIIINGTNIGHTSDTDALAIDSSGNVTASQNLTVTGDLTVSGDDITMGTNTAGNLLIADGTNFNSIAVGSLSEISSIANDDVFLAVDTSGGGLKKVARSTVVSGLATSSAISNVVEDTSPQLGGDLDMNGQDIVTTSNADLELAPNGTGHVTVKGNTNPGTIQFNCESNSHGQQIKAAAHSIGSSAVVTIPDITGDMIVGKIEGTNFTDSLLLGHATTGTLDAAQDNTGVGIGALDAITSGDNNTAVGSDAGTSLTTAGGNTLVGFGAGDAITGAPDNTAIGSGALSGTMADTNSGYNVAVGANSLNVLNGGAYNVAVGRDSGRAVSSGDYNILIGYDGGDNITTGSGNVIIGTVDAAAVDSDRTLKIAGYDGSTTTTWISGNSSGHLTFPDHVYVGNDLYLNSDSARLTFGSNFEIQFTHVHNEGLNLKHTATGDDTPIKLTLQTGETDIAANDVLGAINFQAPDEATGTDAILVAAGIEAVSEGDFSSSSNATKLSFKTAASAAAAETMSLSSDGTLTVSHDVILANDSFVQFGDAGEKISGDGTDLTITSSAKLDLKLGSGNPTIAIYSDGTQFGHIKRNSGNFDIRASESDADITFRGNDGGSAITALTLDMSEAGTATFNHDIILANDSFVQFGDAGENIAGDGTDLTITSSNKVTIDAADDIVLDADGDDIELTYGGLNIGKLSNNNSSLQITTIVSDEDLIIKGNDGGSFFTALTLDMSDAGTAIFNHDIKIADGGQIGSASDADAIAISSAGVVTFSGAANVGQQALTSSSNAVAWDASAKPNAFHVTTENTTFSAPSNAVEGAFICVEINYNGSHTIAWNTVFEFAASTAPTATSTDGKTDILVFRYNGSVWQEVGRTLNLSES